jgi:hypothetical protein
LVNLCLADGIKKMLLEPALPPRGCRIKCLCGCF